MGNNENYATISMTVVIKWNVFCSTGIESVVDESNGKSSGVLNNAMCSACEMAVVWMQNQLQQNQTQENILQYVNEVGIEMNTILHSIIHWGIYFYADFSLCCFYSFVTECQAQWENQQLIVESSLPCLLFRSLLVAKCLTSLQRRYSVVSYLF